MRVGMVRRVTLRGPHTRGELEPRGEPGTVTFAAARTPAAVDAVEGFLAAFPVAQPGVRLVVDPESLDIDTVERIQAIRRSRTDIELARWKDIPIDTVIDLAVPSGFLPRGLRSGSLDTSLIVLEHPGNVDTLDYVSADLIPMLEGGPDRGHLVRVLRAMVAHPGRAARVAAADRTPPSSNTVGSSRFWSPNPSESESTT